jgi:hypothetical protein
MKSFLLRQFDRLVRRATSQTLGKFLGRDGFDVLEVAKLKAAFESASYYEAHLLNAKAMRSGLELLSHAASLTPAEGLVLEFGVASGQTISHLALKLSGRHIYGFDSFEGLPEDWRPGFEKGRFAQTPPVVPANVQLVQGWFDQTLQPFLVSHEGPVALLHVDCDLYSSTKTIFSLLGDRIVHGTVIVFDEYWNYPGWQRHEHLALQELAAERNLSYKYEAFVPAHQQVMIVVQ